MAAAPPARLVSHAADLDGDGDVDLQDFASFQACMTPPTAAHRPPEWPCRQADFDGDGDTDREDFAVFRRCVARSEVPGDPDCLLPPAIPARPPGAPVGSQFAAEVMTLPVPAREERILQEITRGNIPDFLRSFVPVTVSASIDGVAHTATWEVMPDYLAIGSDADFFRIPMGAPTAQAIADRFRCILPTRKMVNDINAAADVKLEPHPFSPRVYNIESVDVFGQSNTFIEAQRIPAGKPLGTLVAGTKKDVVITPQLVTRPNKVAIYGWHRLNGLPIQPLYLGHKSTYMDYSHGIRLVRQSMIVDGARRTITEVLADPVLCVLLSDEGPVLSPRY